MMLYLNKRFTEEELEELKKEIQNAPVGIIVPAEPVIKHLKIKKDIPTVIEYQGRRYVLDHADNGRNK
jgi:hypothetical protein